MAAVSEWIAREYFETLGFFVRQPIKYSVSARSKELEEEVNLLIYNPEVKEPGVPDTMLFNAQQLGQVRCAVVGVRGWHTDRFSPAVLEQSPEIYRFATDQVLESMAAELGEGPVARILCLPALSTSRELQDDALQLLKDQGINGVMTFRSMLMELVACVDTHRNYEKSDLLQIIRILKNYDLLKDAQLELFGPKRRGR